MNKKKKVFRAAIYVRLSKEDGDSFFNGKNESDSITNQKLLIRSFLKKQTDVKEEAVFEDDGYTGTNFERPGFKKLVDAIKSEKIDCVIVKDFSRLGRDYLEVGNYIEKIFPSLGIRFISVNDDYDSLHPKGDSEKIVIPFKNLSNEQTSRETSSRVRTALSVKRQTGLFVGNYAIYGFFRDPENKNHLISDEYASKIVQDIFKMKLDGLSMQAIAERLNERNILAPADYKRNCGQRYRTPFKSELYSKWECNTIRRILTNEDYCGHLIQGKRRKVSYKVKKQEIVAPEDWYRTENVHEAIISQTMFDEVQLLLAEDTRAGGENKIYPLAGKVFCADCGASMVRKMVPRKEKKYFYYVCGNNKKNSKWCSPHSINSDKLEMAVLTTVQAQITILLDVNRALERIGHLAWENREIKKLNTQLDVLQVDIEKNQRLRLAVYEDLKEGLVTKTEYESLRRGFAARIDEANDIKKKLQMEMETILKGFNEQQDFLSKFKQYANISELNRNIVVTLIDKVTVENSGNINVEFRYQDRYRSMLDFVNGEQKTASKDREEVS